MNRPRALIIEDQQNLTVLYEDTLRLLGYDVQNSKDGLAAINQIEMLQEAPHLILLDVNLPRLSGRDVLKHILRREMLKDTTIVVVTANNLMADEMRPLLREGDHFFLKPVRMMDLQRVANEAKPAVVSPEHFVETLETQAISHETLEHEAVPDADPDTTESTSDVAEDELFIAASEETIVNRNGMLWMKNMLAEAAAKQDAELEAQQGQEEETVADRPETNQTSTAD